MPLTLVQLQALKGAIAADAALAAQPATADGAFAIADALNLEAPGPYVVWRSSVAIEEIMANGFVWSEIDALTAGKARIWQWMSQLGSINPSKSNVRQGLRDCFEASAPSTFGNRTTGIGGLQPHLRRNATRAEALFATGTGTTASPATMTWEGRLTYQDVLDARAA
jgi:hypothetical protein